MIKEVLKDSHAFSTTWNQNVEPKIIISTSCFIHWDYWRILYQYTVKSCPQNCNGNGQCNTTNGKCICNPNYKGKTCSSNIHLQQPLQFNLFVFHYRKGLSFWAIPQIIWKMGLCHKSIRIHDVQKSICTM